VVVVVVAVVVAKPLKNGLSNDCRARDGELEVAHDRLRVVVAGALV
jgi:hypothetical protein